MKDANDSIFTLSATIKEPDTLKLAGTVINTSNFSMNNGSISLKVTGGTQPYKISWSDDANQTSLTRTGLIPGYYYAYVYDTNGCNTYSSFNVIAPLMANLTSGYDCNGKGTITINAWGGNGYYYYSLDSITFGYNKVFSNLSTGLYNIWISDNTTVIKLTTTITQHTAFNVTGVVANETTAGAKNGTITLQVAGGTKPYNYNWADNVKLQNRTGLTAGAYYVTVSDSNQCSISKAFSVGTGSSINPLIAKIGRAHV